MLYRNLDLLLTDGGIGGQSRLHARGQSSVINGFVAAANSE